MNANSHHLRGLRRRSSGAIAMPSAPVVPLHTVWPSTVTIETFAPASGAASSRRVTNISVFCGLSLTLMPMFVTCTRLDRTIGLLSRVRDTGARGIGSPSRTAVHTRPVPFDFSAAARSRPCERTASGVPPNRRAIGEVSGVR